MKIKCLDCSGTGQVEGLPHGFEDTRCPTCENGEVEARLVVKEIDHECIFSESSGECIRSIENDGMCEKWEGEHGYCFTRPLTYEEIEILVTNMNYGLDNTPKEQWLNRLIQEIIDMPNEVTFNGNPVHLQIKMNGEWRDYENSNT